MSNYKLKYSGEKIDEILTKADGMSEVVTATGETAGKVKLSDATDSESDVSAGVAATPKAVSQLKEDIDKLFNTSKNLLNLETLTSNSWISNTTGVIQLYNDWSSTDYIPIDGLNTLFFVHLKKCCLYYQWRKFWRLL